MKQARSWLLMPNVLAGLLPGTAGNVACAAEPARLDPVVVTGARASVDSAQARKREQLDIVDGVVAAEIHKLPDLSVSDAVQRIPGVQIVRDRGEGSVVSVRGLTQVETTLNGREVFTAGSGRTLDFADIAAEAVAGIDVFKSASAERIEGGIGGTIDMRTRRPFDFARGANVLSARLIRGDLIDRDAGQFSALVSRRWALTGGGEFGALVNVALQNRAWREDQKSSGTPTVRSDLLPGRQVIAPSSTSETSSAGRRRRSAASLLLQWRPSDALEFYAEGHAASLRTRQDSQQINLSAGSGFVPDSVTLFPGTDDLRSITWTQAPVSVLSFARDTLDRTRQLAAGGRWSDSALTFSGDLSRTTSRNQLFFSGPFFAGTAARFTQDLSGRVPATRVDGTDLLSPANLNYTGLAYRTRPFAGDLSAARLDGELLRPGHIVERLAAGWRYARRRADNAPGLIFADAPISGLSAADTPGRVMPNPFTNFLGGQAPSIGSYLVADLAGARNAAELRQAFGITQAIPAAGNPLSVWQIREQTHALYAMTGWRAPQLPLDGSVGLRVVNTSEAVSGTQSVPSPDGSSGTAPIALIAPIALRSTYTDWLPNATLRLRIDPGLLLRAAASRTITRPNFDQLSPSLSLLRNSVDPSLNQGSAGNPELRPMRASNLDLAIEHYAGPAHSASLTLFWKKVDGFVATFAQDELHDGVKYSVSRPYNNDPADIRGVELAWQRFFDFLPGAWRGLGLQVNYTYVDSSTPDRVLGVDAALQNLSRHSGNLIGIYEHGPVVARIACNWRGSFRSGAVSVVGVGALPVTTHGYGWLDASFGYRFGDGVTLTLEGSNLLRSVRRSYHGVATRPQSVFVNDRQIAANLSVRF